MTKLEWQTIDFKPDERGAKPEKPTWLTCLMDDATIEAVAKRINDNPRGVLLSKDELSHWFESFDQYHDRAGADVSRWLSIWTGNYFALDLVELIARVLRQQLPSMPTDLATRYAEKIASALQREGYLAARES
jgi:hypothetical protein